MDPEVEQLKSFADRRKAADLLRAQQRSLINVLLATSENDRDPDFYKLTLEEILFLADEIERTGQ